ncbi:MAG: hypothetical protein R3B54_13630 [Bdellovibrionota bacterium]
MFRYIIASLLLTGCSLISKQGAGLFGLPAMVSNVLSRVQSTALVLNNEEIEDRIGVVPNGVCPPGVDQLLCDSLNQMTDQQRTYLVAFLKSAASSLIAMSAEKPHRLEASIDKDFMKNERGEAVVGKTKYGPLGSIYVYTPETQQYSIARMMVLITHELLHKAESNLSEWLTDFSSYGPFASGRDLADRAGAALTVLSATLDPLDRDCPEILVSHIDGKVFYAAYAPEHEVGGPGICGRSWKIEAGDPAGKLVGGHTRRFASGLKLVEFVARVDNLVGNEVVADLIVREGNRSLSHRLLRRSDFSTANEFESQALLVDAPLDARLSFEMHSKGGAALEILGVKVEGVRGARSFLADWDYHEVVTPGVAGPVPGSYLVEAPVSNQSLKRGLNLTGVNAGPQQVVFFLEVQGNVATAPSLNLEIWERQISGGQWQDVSLIASRTLSSGELSFQFDSIRPYAVGFTAQANKNYDFRLRVVEGVDSVLHTATAIYPQSGLVDPVEGVFKHAGRHYRTDLANGAFCRYLSFEEVRYENPALTNDLGLPVLNSLPDLAGGGLCELRPVDGSFFKTVTPVEYGYQPGLEKTTYYVADVANKKVRRCLSRLDLKQLGLMQIEFRDPRENDFSPVLSHYPERLAGTFEDTLSCTGFVLQERPNLETDCSVFKTPDESEEGQPRICSPGGSLQFGINTAGLNPLGTYTVSINYFKNSNVWELSVNSDLQYWAAALNQNLYIPSAFGESGNPYDLWVPETREFEVYDFVHLPVQRWCFEIVDYYIPYFTQNRARTYLCLAEAENPGISFTPDMGKTWYESFYTY